MNKLILFSLILILSSCEVYENYQQLQYPGDYFSRTIASAKCDRLSDNSFKYELAEGIVELHLNLNGSYIIDKRGKETSRIALDKLYLNKRIDNSLRYLIREGMTFRQVSLLLGPNGEKWGGVTANMVVWKMADGRHVAIMPSTLEMPTGMNYYHILAENEKLTSVVKLLPLGQAELPENR